MVDEVLETAAKKTSKKGAKKAAKKGAKNGTKKPVKKAAKKAAKSKAAKGAPRQKKSTIAVEEVVKMMQRKGGVTIKQMNEAGFWQPAVAAFRAAERRDLKPKKEKIKGSPTVYSCGK